MKTKLTLEVEIEIVDEFLDDKDTIARVYYPDEGNSIKIVKGLNKFYAKEALFHEVGHVIDWYLSNEKQSNDVQIREKNAEVICDHLKEIKND